MRLLFAVVHYYKSGDGRHGSLATDPRPRIDALRSLILQLHRLYGEPAGLLNHLHRRVDSVNDGGGSIDLRVCVSGDCHVLDRLSGCEGLYQKQVCHPDDPRLLGFEAQRVLVEASQEAEKIGEPFDYIAYLEDDILLTDADFFLKLRCFNRAFGDQYLLMPNRIETLEHQGQLRRFYIDGDYNPAAPRHIAAVRIRCSAFLISARWCALSSPRTSIQAVFFLTANKRAFMPAVAMQQQSTSVFTAHWRVRPRWACSKLSS